MHSKRSQKNKNRRESVCDFSWGIFRVDVGESLFAVGLEGSLICDTRKLVASYGQDEFSGTDVARDSNSGLVMLWNSSQRF